MILMLSNGDIIRIFMKLRGNLARTIAAIVPPSEIEDIIQETYVRACQASSPESIKKPKAYLYKVARNLALDYTKRAETQRAVSENVVADEVAGEMSQVGDVTLRRVISGDHFADFCEAVRRLPRQQRRAFILRKVYGYSQKEIAEQMRISQKTVERHISLGMERCVEFLRKYEDAETENGSASPSSKDGQASGISHE